MRIISKALTREVAVNALATAVALTLILSSSRLVRYFADVAEGKLPGDLVAALMGYKLLWAVMLIVPVSLFIAVILALARWHRDSEMVALAAAGVGDGRLLRTVTILAVIAALLVAGFSFYLSPWSNEMLTRVEEQAAASDQLQMIRSGQFNRFAEGERVFYVEQVLPEQGVMVNVFVQMSDGPSRVVLVAEQARARIDSRDHGKFLALENGHRYDGVPGQANYQITGYQEYAVRIRDAPVTEKLRRRDALPSSALWGSTALRDIAELQWRFSAPLQTIVLALLAVPLSYASPRAGRGGSLILAVMVYLVYSNLLSVCQSWLGEGKIPPWMGLWWVHAVMVLLFFILLRRSRPGSALSSLFARR